MTRSFVAAYFDSAGLYAYSRQPRAVFRNLQRLAEALSDLADQNALAAALADFPMQLQHARAEFLQRRLGLKPLGHDDDQAFSSLCWDFLASTRIPYDRFFFDWYGGAASVARANESPVRDAYQRPTFEALKAELQRRAPLAPAALNQPYFQREAPCTLVIDEVERVWQAIDVRNDFDPFIQKIADIRELGAALA